VLEADLTDATTGDALARLLLADTGGGDASAGFELILHEDDCLRCGGRNSHHAALGGAYSGRLPVYSLRVRIPTIGFDKFVHAVAVSDIGADFDGIACFRFLNRFTYGNFGDPDSFGLEA
jgi:hypothetical protein